MGSSKKKTTQVTDPAAWAKDAVVGGVNQTQDIYNQNAGNLKNLSNTAYAGAQSLANQAFNPNPYLTNAQNITSQIGSGALYGSNPGASTYARLQSSAANDPSMGILQSLANGGANNPGNSIAQQVASGGKNPATGLATGVAKGQYLNAQPSAGLYDSLINGDPAVNPYVDAIAQQAEDAAITAANRRFGAAGQGAGVSGALGQNISKGVADANNTVRYQAYNDAANRQLQAAGQSDSVWSGERGRMDAATGLLSSDYNSAQDRALSAAGLLSNNFNNAQTQQLSAAQALGQQYGQGEDRALEAAKAGDTSNNAQIAQILQALGMQPGLAAGQYGGVASALAALQSAAQLPYTGQNQYTGNISQLTSPYRSSTTTEKTSGLGAAIGNIAQLAGGIGSLMSPLGALGGAGAFLGGAPAMGNLLGSSPLSSFGLDLSGLNLNPSY